MHQLKYRNNPDLGIQLGRLMGEQLLASGRFPADALVPLPLFPARERKRGYNQAMLLCQGIRDATRLPILDKLITRPEHTETQTRKGRIARWKNMEGKFFLDNKSAAEGRHLLLIDDVITTGATLESCGNTLLEAGNVTLSVASLCYASR
jgi:ComF family protein